MILLRWLTFLLRYLTLTDLLFWIYFFLLTLLFVLQCLFSPLWNSDHFVVSVSIDFPTSKQINMQVCWPFTSCFPWTLGSLWKCGILVDVLQNWLNWSHFLFLKESLLVILIDYMIFLPLFLDVSRRSMSTISFLAQLDWNSLPIECFPLTNDLIGRHLLPLDSSFLFLSFFFL